MKCNICDRPLDEPKFNPDIGQFDPCETCWAVIEDTLSGYKDNPIASEDDLGGPDPDLSELASSPSYQE